MQSSNPPADISRDVANLLASTNNGGGGGESTFLGYVDVKVGYDSNSSRATTEESVLIPSGPVIPLGVDSRQQSSAYNAGVLGFQYYQPVADSLGFIMTGSAEHKNYFDNNTFDETIFKLRAGFNQKTGVHNFRFWAKGQLYELNHSTFSRIWGVTGDWLMNGSHGWDYNAGLIYNQLEYPNNFRRAPHSNCAAPCAVGSPTPQPFPEPSPLVAVPAGFLPPEHPMMPMTLYAKQMITID